MKSQRALVWERITYEDRLCEVDEGAQGKRDKDRVPRVKDSRSGALEKERPPGGRLRTSRAQRASPEPRRDGRPHDAWLSRKDAETLGVIIKLRSTGSA